MPRCVEVIDPDSLDNLVLDNAERLRANVLSTKPNREYIMGFVQQGSSYSIAKDAAGNGMQTSGSSERVKGRWPGQKIVAGLHGHPNTLDAKFLSGYDINHVGKAERRVYLVTPNGAVLRFDVADYTLAVLRAQAPRLGPPPQIDFSNIKLTE
jgi:hypothetical protein